MPGLLGEINPKGAVNNLDNEDAEGTTVKRQIGQKVPQTVPRCGSSIAHRAHFDTTPVCTGAPHFAALSAVELTPARPVFRLLVRSAVSTFAPAPG